MATDAMKLALEDDSSETKMYYQNLFAGHQNKEVLGTITDVLNAWSKVVRTGAFATDTQALFEEALRHSHEYVWYEAGSRLARLIPYREEAEAIFKRVLNDRKWQSRFNVVACSHPFDPALAHHVLKEAINDRSSKVREKVADAVLKRQDRQLLGILRDRLKVEKSARVIDAINFALEHFDSVQVNEDGSLVFSST